MDINIFWLYYSELISYLSIAYLITINGILNYYHLITLLLIVYSIITIILYKLFDENVGKFVKLIIVLLVLITFLSLYFLYKYEYDVSNLKEYKIVAGILVIITISLFIDSINLIRLFSENTNHIVKIEKNKYNVVNDFINK